MSTFLNILIIIGILTSTICSFHSEKEKQYRVLIVAGAIVAIGAVFTQAAMKYKDDKEQRNELLEAQSRHNDLKSQNDALLEKINIVSEENTRMKDILTNPTLEYIENQCCPR